MSASLAMDSEVFALELHALLRELDPARWRADLEGLARTRSQSLRTRARALLDALQPIARSASADVRWAALAEPLTATEQILERMPAANLPPGSAKRAWRVYQLELLDAYEGLSRTLAAWDIHVPSLRPTNYARNVLHVIAAAAAIGVLVLLAETPWLTPAAGFFTVLGWSLEASRRLSPWWNGVLMWVFGPVAHPHESHRVNSATWYCTALLALALLDTPTAAMIGLVALGVGDPAAAVIGRRWGRHRLANGRSAEGFAAFILTSTLVAAPLTATYAGLGLPTSLLLAACASTVGAVVELVSRRIDDNLSIPVSTAVTAWLLLPLLTP